MATATEPYLSLSGTSMASPVVSGTIALMLQANPALTPNQVKAILQFTAERRDGYDALTEGAGFLNARGAVEAARAAASGTALEAHTDPTPWSGQIFWGNRRLSGTALLALPSAGAWAASVMWGAPNVLGALGEAAGTDNIVWGAACGGADCAPSAAPAAGWGGTCAQACGPAGGEEHGIAWSTAHVDDVLWSAPPVRRPRIEAVMDAALP